MIENKSENAIDQPNQLYRYWYYQIYTPTKSLGTKYSLGKKDKYRIVYLPSESFKKPTPNTLSKPESLKAETDLPESLSDFKQDLITEWSFRKEIVEWLELALKDKRFVENHRLREYLVQYINYWK